MRMTKLIKTVALAAGLASAASAYAAGGDIYEIRPCNYDGTSRAAYATAAQPLNSGETVYFNVRLVQRTIGDPNSTWKLQHIGLNSEAVDWLFPLEIGIYVSGQLRYAKLVDIKSVYTGYTDLIFSYTTQSGDFALPIVLATGEGGSVTYDDSTDAYLLHNTDKWKKSYASFHIIISY